MIEVKAPASGWHEVTQEQARVFVRDRLIAMQAIPASEREQYINTHLLRGASVQDLMQEENHHCTASGRGI